VRRIWVDAGLEEPHIAKGFKVWNDPLFEDKVTELVGLYLDPPDRAVVLCVNEKSQTQALDGTQLGLSLTKGRGHDDPRLQTPWHHHALRRVGRQVGRGNRGMYASPSRARVFELPTPHR
jgi:hypothetical protein